jgi:hypothetical protein
MSDIKISYRENIAKDIVKAIKGIKSVRYTSRDVFEIDELSEAQFPAVLVQTGSEIKTESSMGNRMGTIEYVLTGFVKGKYLDTARNKLADVLEEKLYVDRTRNAYAVDTIVTEVITDEGVIFPMGAIQMMVTVEYIHQTGDLTKS